MVHVAAMPRGADRDRPMRVNGGLAAAHSPDFAAAWRSVYCRVYGWRREGRFAVVPSLSGRPVFAYLPGLNYSDLNAADARELAREAGGRPHNVRALSALEGEPPPGSLAVLRLDLGAFGRDRTVVWERALAPVARKRIRGAWKRGLRASVETGAAAMEAFAALLSATLARHGAPMMPVTLFSALVDALDARILVVRGPGGEALASLLWFLDGVLAWNPWSGNRRDRDAGDLLAWTLIEEALNAGADIVDFGRSPVGGGCCRFKQKFGAAPVPVLWLSDRRADLHRLYAPAMKLWGALPNVVTGAVGPRLCRYLADY